MRPLIGEIDVGVREIDGAVVDRRLRRGHVGLRLARRGNGVVVVLAR